VQDCAHTLRLRTPSIDSRANAKERPVGGWGVMMYEVDGDEMAEYAARRAASEHWLAEFRRPCFGVDQ